MYDARDWAAYFAALVTNGICHEDDLKVGALLETVPGKAGKVNFSNGSCIINGHMFTLNDSAAENTSVEIPASPASGYRNDLVCVRLDIANRKMEFVVIAENTGMTRNDTTFYDIALARVRVPAGATMIRDTFITDLRMDKQYCGLAALRFDGNTDVTKFFTEWSGKMQELYNSIQIMMSGDAAAWLQTQINNLTPLDIKGTLNVSDWEQDEEHGWYYQDFNYPSLSEDSLFYTDCDMSEALVSNASIIQDDWALIGRAYVENGRVRFICYDEQPSHSIPFILRIVKYTSLGA